MANTRSQTIDALKGVAILIVMAGHVLTWNHMEDAYIYDVIKVIQMPLFMMVSGYLCGISRRVGNIAQYGQVLKKRGISYLVPFFFWIVLLHPFHPISSVIDTLFCLDKGLWFLMTLFLLNLMIYTAQLAGEKAGRCKRLVFWTVYFLMAAFVVLETLLGWEFLSPGLTRLYLPFYLAGYLTGEYREAVKRISEKWKIVLCILAAGGLLYLAAACDLLDVGSILFLGRQILASFLGCYVIIYLMTICHDGKAKRFLAWLGGYTLEVYVLHFHFAALLNRGETYNLYSLQGLLFFTASFVVMSLITAVIIVTTKRVPVLDFLLYGKLRRRI